MEKKKYLWPILYWVVLFILPLIIVSYYQKFSYDFDWPGYTSFFVIFISPILYIIPYRIIKPSTKKDKIIVLVYEFVIPLILFYIFIVWGILSMIHSVF